MSGALEEFKAREARGEFTLVVGGKTKEERSVWTEDELLAAIETELKRGKSAKEISVELAEQSGWGKRDVYARVNQKK